MRTVATRVAAARRALVVAVVLIGGGVFLSQTNVFQNLGLTLLGTAGALTLVLGFAARQVLGNIMASMQIALNQSARIGDRIVYKDYLCHVERINFTYVQLRDWDGTRLVVPVDEFISTPFENWTMQEPEMLRIIKLKCAHQADVDQLRTIFDRVVASLDPEELGDLDDAKVRVAGQDALGKDVWFALPCADPNTSWDMACKAREKLIAEATDLEKSQNIDIFPEARLSEAA
ncbi:MAG: mechanosensitive ion channel [Roseobacter sp.]|nr:mechanosensitive ion channel [Roseobacter sp.]